MADTAYDDIAWVLLAQYEPLDNGGRRKRSASEMVVDVAEALRRMESIATSRERERCAGMVREMARWADAASEEAHHTRKEHDCDKPAYLEGRADALDEVMRMAGDLAERIGKGEP